MRIHALLLITLFTTPLIGADKKTDQQSPSEALKAEALAKRPRVPGRLAVTLRDR